MEDDSHGRDRDHRHDVSVERREGGRRGVRRGAGRHGCRASLRAPGSADRDRHPRRPWRDGGQRRSCTRASAGPCRAADERRLRRLGNRRRGAPCLRDTGRERRWSTLASSRWLGRPLGRRAQARPRGAVPGPALVRPRPAAIAAARVSRAGLVRGGLGLASAVFVVFRHARPTRNDSSHGRDHLHRCASDWPGSRVRVVQRLIPQQQP